MQIPCLSIRLGLKQALLAVAPLALLAGAFSAKADETARRLDESQVHIIQKIAPSYPTIAHQMHLSGVVIMDVVVDESGNVAKAEPVNGNPILTGAAAMAARRWKFAPIVEDGKPVSAVVRVAFKFTE